MEMVDKIDLKSYYIINNKLNPLMRDSNQIQVQYRELGMVESQQEMI